MAFRTPAILLAGLALLAGCATPRQSYVSLPGDYFSARGGRIGVAMSEIPRPDTSFPGANCLLCLATASLANGAMTSAVQGWPTVELKVLKPELVAALKARGQDAMVIDEPLRMEAVPDRKGAEADFARKDFSAWKTKAGVDRLLVVNVQALGVSRNYSAYVPAGEPWAVFRGEAYIVDLTTHRLDWYETIDLVRPADGSWDEPPGFPGLTNAHFQVMEEGKDAIKKAFAK